jgi:hypothetical protein
VLGMAEEFKEDGIAVNALWPKFSVYYILCHFIHLYPNQEMFIIVTSTIGATVTQQNLF